MRGELPNLLNFSFQHFGHVSVSAFSFLICRKLFPNLRTAGHDSCPGVKCGFAPSPPLGETQEVSKLNNSYWVQPPKIPLPSSDNSGSKESIKGTFLCVFTRELVGMQAECVAAYVRLTRLPHRDHSPYQLHSHLSSECTFSGSAVRNALCLLNRLLPSPIVIVNKPFEATPHDPLFPCHPIFCLFWRDSKLLWKNTSR